MWGWISGSKSPAVNLPVNVGEETGQCLAGRLVFKVHTATHKTSNEPLSVFKFESGPSTTPEQLAVAKSEFKRLRVLRHPSVVKYVDGVDSESLVVIVTEPVTPLLYHIQSEASDVLCGDSICWGLHQLVTSLKFLHEDCKIAHRNLYSSSVFVSHTGDWKLGGVAWCEDPTTLTAPSRVNQYLSKYDAPEVLRGVNTSPTSVDVWQLGVLMWELFNGNMSSPQSLRDTSKIPAQLLPVYRECVSSNFKSRPAIGAVYDKLAATYFKNSFVSTNIFLDEISMKERAEKEAFFTRLPDSQEFPARFSKYKLLPALTTTFEFGDVGVEVLGSLFKLGKLLNEDEYKSKILPCVIKLFSSTDRAMRIQLLTQLHNFIEYLDNKTVDTQIFPAVCTGFTDTIPGMREQTVKSMLQLTAKLSESTIDNILLKYLAKAQTDAEPPIRTNTTICISKICCHFSDATRRKVLLPAFLRALKDPFLHARNAGLLSLGCTSQYYSETDIASRILPSICPLLMDHERTVRDQALKTVRHFLDKIERYHKGLPDNPPPATTRKQPGSGGVQENAAAAPKGWASWAVSSVSNITSKYSAPQSKIGEIQKPASEPTPANTGGSKDGEGGKNPATQPPETHDEEENDENDDAWDDLPRNTMTKGDGEHSAKKPSLKLGGVKNKAPAADDDSIIDSILREEQGSLKMNSKQGGLSLTGSKLGAPSSRNNPTSESSLKSGESDQGQNSQILSSYFTDNSDDFFGQMGVGTADNSSAPAKSEWDDFNLKLADDTKVDDWDSWGAPEKPAPKSTAQRPNHPVKSHQKSADPSFDDWSEDWGDMNQKPLKTPAGRTAPKTKGSQNKPVKSGNKASSSFGDWGINDDWGGMSSNNPSSNNPSQSVASNKSKGDSFGDWGNDDWGDLSNSTHSKQQVASSNISTTQQVASSNISSSKAVATSNISTTQPVASSNTSSTKPVASSNTAGDWDSSWDTEPVSREEKRRQQRERRANRMNNKTSGLGGVKKS